MCRQNENNNWNNWMREWRGRKRIKSTDSVIKLMQKWFFIVHRLWNICKQHLLLIYKRIRVLTRRRNRFNLNKFQLIYMLERASNSQWISHRSPELRTTKCKKRNEIILVFSPFRHRMKQQNANMINDSVTPIVMLFLNICTM